MTKKQTLPGGGGSYTRAKSGKLTRTEGTAPAPGPAADPDPADTAITEQQEA